MAHRWIRSPWLALALALVLPAWAAGPFRFGVISDVHMDLDKLRGALEDLAAQGAGAVVLVGDTCDGLDREYAGLAAFLQAVPRPERRFFVMGNHEYYAAFHPGGGDYDEAGFPNGETSDACRRRFNRFRGARPGGPVYYDARVEGFHFIFLGGERSRMDAWGLQDDAVLTPRQRRWLRARLAQDAPGGRPVFVFLHQPLQDGPAPDGTRSVRPGGALRRILAGHPEVVLFSGHTHAQLGLPGTHNADPAGFHRFNTSSVRDPYDARDLPAPASMSEGLLVEAGGGKVVVRGRDFLGRRDLPGQRFEVSSSKGW